MTFEVRCVGVCVCESKTKTVTLSRYNDGKEGEEDDDHHPLLLLLFLSSFIRLATGSKKHNKRGLRRHIEIGKDLVPKTRKTTRSSLLPSCPLA